MQPDFGDGFAGTERNDRYDPFDRGPFPVGVVTVQAPDPARDRLFPCEIWYPAAAHHAGQDLAPDSRDLVAARPDDTPRARAAVRDAEPRPGTYPLVVFSHHGGGHRRSATFLCTHLSSHGYVVAALDHWEVVAEETWRPRLARGPRSPHPMSSGGSGRWWRWRRVAAPSRGPGSFRRSWRSG